MDQALDQDGLESGWIDQNLDQDRSGSGWIVQVWVCPRVLKK